MVTISACIIVKNEEAVLARCLDSLCGLVDEIIIVDTGSSDRTKEIAAGYTDKIFDFIWVDDFSKARNFSFSKAAMEYIYQADADEVINEENRKRFLMMKECLLPEIDIVQMYYKNQMEYNTTYNFDCELRPKLYRRLREFRFSDPIHEAVILDPVIYDSEIEILHLPQGNHAKRDFYTFQNAVKKNGFLSERLTGMYARELFIAGEENDFIEAEPFFLELSQMLPINQRELKICFCVLAKAYRVSGREFDFFKVCLKSFAGELQSSETCYELGEYYHNKGDYREAVIWFYNAAYETEPELNLQYGAKKPLNRLADCYNALGDFAQEEKYRAFSQESAVQP